MAASAAKYAHCHIRLPVRYHAKSPFRPMVAAPLDFAARAAEVQYMDRELDRAVLGPREFALIINEEISRHPGPGGLFVDRSGSTAPKQSRSPKAVQLRREQRRYVLNELRLAGDATRFRPPWTVSVIQEVHSVLHSGLGLPENSGEFRDTAFTARNMDGEDVYVACAPERIRTDLGAVLDWLDRYGATMMPIIPASVLFQAFHSIRPFPVGNMTTARALTRLYLRSYGLPNSGVVPIAEHYLEGPALLLRLLLWTETSGSYTELVDYTTDAMMLAYLAGTRRWLAKPALGFGLEEVPLRLLIRARRNPGWFSARDASRWVGGRSDQTVLRHLNTLVRKGLLESLGQTRAKRYRGIPAVSTIAHLVRRFSIGRRDRGESERETGAPSPEDREAAYELGS